MSAKLILKAIFFQKEKIKNIIVDGQEYNYQEEIEATIQFNEIESEIGIKVVKIEIVIEDEKDASFFEIMKDTTIIGYLLPEIGQTLDIILNEKCTFQIFNKISKKKYINLDVKDNRLLIININIYYKLYIDNKNQQEPTKEPIYDRKNISKILLNLARGKSNQISIQSLNDNIYFYREVEPLNFDQFFNFYNKFNGMANDFFSEINDKLLKNDKIDKIIKKYSDLLDGCDLRINLPPTILAKKYNEIEYFNFISNYCLYRTLSLLKNKEINEIRNFINFFIEFKTNLNNNNKLENYLKCIIINDFSKRLNEYKSVKDFKDINYQYYIRKELEPDSPLYTALMTLEKFEENLTESCPFFYPLVLIDSEKYIYEPRFGQTKVVFGYGLTSNNILKKHLNDKIPEVIITFNDANIYKNDQGILNKKSGVVELNLSCKLLSCFKNNDINKKIDNKIKLNNLTLRVYIALFLEVYGHKKEGYSFKNQEDEFLLSPKWFYDKKKAKIMALDYIDSIIINQNTIKTLRDPEAESDTISLLEYYLGETKNDAYFIYSLIEIMLIYEVDLNFVLNVELWNERVETLRKYIELKYTVFINDREILDCKSFKDINEEIDYLEQVIKEKKFENQIQSENAPNLIYINNIIKKRKELSLSKKRIKNLILSGDISVKEIFQRYNDKKTSDEEKEIYKDIILNRFQRK